MIKLIALDMDGTLLNNDKVISLRNQNTIQAAKQAGITVVLASGRPLQGLYPYLEMLGLTGPEDFVVSYNGSLVQRVASGEILQQTSLSGSDAKALHNVAQDLGVFIHAFSAKQGLITHQHNQWTGIEAKLNGMVASEVDFSQLIDDEGMVKVMMVAEEKILDSAIANLPAALKLQYTVVRSAPFFLEFLHPSSNKGVAIEYLTTLMGLTAEQVMCVGDAENDHAMLKFAGLAVAMENADAETKALADYIAPSNQDDGVAIAIEKHALQFLLEKA